MSSLMRGLNILEFVASQQARGVTFTEINSNTGYPQSSCFRLLKELTELKYLVFDEKTRCYHLTMQVARLGASVTGESELYKLLHPCLEKLRDESDKTCNLGIMDNDRGMFLDVIYSRSNTIKLLSKIGASFPLHCTALGKVLLAHAEPHKRNRLLAMDLFPLTPRTIRNRDYLEEQLEKILEDGYASEHEESTLGIHCFAAPVFDYSGNNIAAVSMACPYFEFEKPGMQENLIELVKSYGKNMSSVMGHKTQASAGIN